MAGSFLKGSLEYLQIPVALARPAEVGMPWQGADGKLYKPGDVVEDGNIVSATPGELIGAGVVLIASDKLSEAVAAGWFAANERPDDAGLIKVQR